MKIVLGIDFGSENLTIFKKGEGVIFKEPSLLCVKKTNNNYVVLALGEGVKKIKDDDINQIIFSPLAEGVVKSVEYAGLLLKYALNKVFKVLIFKNFEASIAVPCGLGKEETEKYIRILKLAGIPKINIIPSPLCINRSSNATSLIIDIGTAKTDIAVIQSGGIISGATLGLGGYNIDAMILQKLSEKHHAYFSEISAQKIKEEIGSLLPNDKGCSQLVGIDMEENNPHNYPVNTNMIYPQIETVFAEIVKVAKSLIYELPESLQNDLSQNSVLIVGSSARMTGAEKYFSDKLGLKCIVPDNAEDAVALGFRYVL